MAEKKTKLTRNDAEELYRDLHKTMSNIKEEPKAKPKKGPIDNNVAKQIAEAIRSGMKQDDAIAASGGKINEPAPARGSNKAAPEAPPTQAMRQTSYSPPSFISSASGSQMALVTVLFFVFAKVCFSVLEYSGAFGVPMAHATLAPAPISRVAPSFPNQYGESEVIVLKQLDARRVELKARDQKMKKREKEFQLQEQELVARASEVRELTERLKLTRQKNTVKRNNQLEQLSNVYGSMNPKEAAALIEQLDVTIALSLLERMPEKRIGQILSLMGAERALTITRMLSSREVVR